MDSAERKFTIMSYCYTIIELERRRQHMRRPHIGSYDKRFFIIIAL